MSQEEYHHSYHASAALGENMPLHSLDRAYKKGRIDERLEVIKDFERQDEGKNRTNYKTAVHRLQNKNMTAALKGSGFFIPLEELEPVSGPLDRKNTYKEGNGDTRAFLLFLLTVISTFSLLYMFGG